MLMSVSANKILWEKSRFIITVRHCVHCAKGKKGQRQFTYHLFSFITGIKTNILLHNFLFNRQFNVGVRLLRFWNLETEGFDWTKVCIIVMTCILL